jgi:hypothetical protein
MSEKLPVSTPERNELLDDNARKFVVEAIDHELLQGNGVISYSLTVDWLETDEHNEKKLAYKQFDSGDRQILLISKLAENGKRLSKKTPISEDDYNDLRNSSILHLKKRRYEFVSTQDAISFSIKFDEFAGSPLRILEVDAATERERNSFDPSRFPAGLAEVTGEISYYGYRVASLVAD